MSYLYQTFCYQPLYNGLIFLLAISPSWVDAGTAILIFTLLVKLVLYPLSKASIVSQIKMKEMQPRMDEIKKKFTDPSQQSMATLALYKEMGVNPFSGILLLFIQIPIIFALYKLFLSGGLPTVDPNLLYSFVSVPQVIDMHFFGIDISQKSIILAFIAAVAQYFQIKYSVPEVKHDPTAAPSFGNDFAKMMSVQMKYVLPVIVFVASFTVNAGIAIYLFTSSIFAIAQELYIRKALARQGLKR